MPQLQELGYHPAYLRLAVAIQVNDPRIIVALDFPSQAQALDCARRLTPELCRVKVGKELFTAAGPAVVEALMALGFEVFLDLKFHDIPATVAKACRAAASLGVWMVNVHALGGPRMLAAAREALEQGHQRPLLIAVTILTSASALDLRAVGLAGEAEEHVLRLACLAREQGLDGVVCSAREAPLLREHCGEAFCLVTPGIRPRGNASDDQVRIVTPVQALRQGADYLVIGRPITQAAEPRTRLEAIQREIAPLSHP